jgi:diaminopimelate decarboxylase
MHHFRYAGQNLHCESVDLAEVARLYGTPTYVYSAQTITENYTRLAGSLKGLDVRVCFAVKANANLAVLRHLGNLGSAFDFASAGEMRRERPRPRSARRSRPESSRSTSRASRSSPASTTSRASWA